MICNIAILYNYIYHNIAISLCLFSVFDHVLWLCCDCQLKIMCWLKVTVAVTFFMSLSPDVIIDCCFIASIFSSSVLILSWSSHNVGWRQEIHPWHVSSPSQHTHTHHSWSSLHLGQFRVFLPPKSMLLGCGRKPEYSEKTHAHMGTTCTCYIKILAVRQHTTHFITVGF